MQVLKTSKFYFSAVENGHVVQWLKDNYNIVA
jgi:hypothetical protein